MSSKTRHNKTKYMWSRLRHNALWTWLAENPAASKSEWPGWEFNGGKAPVQDNSCFACTYAGESPDNDSLTNCAKCPIQWVYYDDGTAAPTCNPEVRDTVYTKWCKSEGGISHRIMHAVAIALMWPEWDDRHHKDEEGEDVPT